MIKSLRMDPELANQVKQAARLRGVTESRFIRDVVAEASRAALERASVSIWAQVEDLADLEGSGEQVSVSAHEAFERGLVERHGSAR